MRHVMIAVALLAVIGLDVVFIHFSGTAASALTFGVLGFVILLLFSATAGSFVSPTADYPPMADRLGLGSLLGSGISGFVARVLLGSCFPVLLMLAVVYIPDLDRSLVPSQAIRLGTTAATFGLLGALPLVGAVLGFLWPRSGPLESVVVGGMVVLDYGMISWGAMGVSREALLLALYDLMVWPALALIGAWVGASLHQLSQVYVRQTEVVTPLQTTLATASNGAYHGETAPASTQTPHPGQAGQPGLTSA